MEKKFVMFGMAVLLGVSLSFFGCEHGPGKSEAELAAIQLAASGDFAGKATVDGATVTLTEGVTLTADADVAAGVTLAVAGGTALTVNAGTALTVAGTYTLAQGATVTNNGTVTIKSGGVSKSHDNDNSAGATGFTVVETGGKAYFKENLYFGDTDAANFQLGASSTLAFNKAGYVLNGTATLNGITGHLSGSGWDGKGWGLYAKGGNGQQLTLKAGSTLTIAGNTILDLNGTTEKQAIVGETGASVAASGGIQLWIYTDINFYDNAGAALSGKSFNTGNGIPVTFNWAADAGSAGGDQPGWKAAAGS